MSLLFISTWMRDIHIRYNAPWEDDCERCAEEPMWTCEKALRKFYKYTKYKNTYIDPIPPYLTQTSDIIKRYRRQRNYHTWNCTDIESVSDRIRIYK